jgi:hypothetical protein
LVRDRRRRTRYLRHLQRQAHEQLKGTDL